MDVRVSAFLLFCLLHLIQSKVVDLSCKQVREFVDGHNERRLKLAQGKVAGQPTATEMKYMVWDEELAEKATTWASKNQFLHNPDQTTGSDRFKTGENIYKATSNNPHWEIDIDSVLSAWFDEHKDYKFGPLKDSDFSGNTKPIGHYTQMAWSDSIHVGCGISETFHNGQKEYLVVCNYGPGGNYIGEMPYKARGPGSRLLMCVNEHCNNPYGRYC